MWVWNEAEWCPEVRLNYIKTITGIISNTETDDGDPKIVLC